MFVLDIDDVKAKFPEGSNRVEYYPPSHGQSVPERAMVLVRWLVVEPSVNDALFTFHFDYEDVRAIVPRYVDKITFKAKIKAGEK